MPHLGVVDHVVRVVLVQQPSLWGGREAEDGLCRVGVLVHGDGVSVCMVLVCRCMVMVCRCMVLVC